MNLVIIILFVILVKAIFLSFVNKSFSSTESRQDNENFSEIGQATRMQIVAGGAGGGKCRYNFAQEVAIIRHNPLRNPGSVWVGQN